ncbi:hypothetical protein I5M32_06895 [Pedobacter sp. SD-b]|uniref:DNA mismatch repair proteins mutS family domain-containing protein n=1 Tax=Pedobacter segetis TaxID=2793069 RepID=A0ABS1BIV9_9SPHI|nr:hypothetical protein [Pedobacter segetis]MBK0382686.1 hypothetical protein [Pedobacter segetis]
MKSKVRENLNNSFGKIKDDYFNFSQIEKYFRKKDQTGAYQVLSDKTCNDLDFQDLFITLDRTTSKVGQQYYYHLLRTIPQHPSEKIKTREEILYLLKERPSFRLDVQMQLSKLKNDNSFYISNLFQDQHIERPKWFPMVNLLAFTSLASFVLMFFNAHLFFVFLATFIINLGVHYWNKSNLNAYLASLPQLLNLHQVAFTLFKNSNFQKINLNLQQALNSVGGLKKRMIIFRMENNVQGDLAVIVWAFLELLKIMFLLEPMMLFGILTRLDNKRKEVEEIFDFVGEIDSLCAIASLRHGLGCFCIPTIIPNPQILANEIYHPLIKDCVKNNIALTDKSILLTGSNMSGKSSFIRAIGINVLTGLTLNTCFAKDFSMPRLKLYSAIRISDDLLNDKSYYFEEVLSIKKMIEESQDTEPHLFLLDEIFKGTNTVERIAAGKAVLSYLAKNNNQVFVSTHDIELADLLIDEYDLYHFSESVGNQSVDFDYQIKKGKLINRNAIKILEVNQYPKSIIDEAISISQALDQNKFKE